MKQEQRATAEISKSLGLVEKDKLYIDLGYSSLFQYLVKELNHSEGDGTSFNNGGGVPGLIPVATLET